MIKTKAQPFTLSVLPYEQNALEPYLSARTLDFHCGKHHQTYVNKLNELVSGSEFAELKLAEVIAKTSGDDSKGAILNNAAQVWNHTFYWNSLSPEVGRKPSGELVEKAKAALAVMRILLGNLLKQEWLNSEAAGYGLLKKTVS